MTATCTRKRTKAAPANAVPVAAKAAASWQLAASRAAEHGELPLDLVHAAILRGLVDGPDPAKTLPPGTHQVRGRVTLELDCWLEKGREIEVCVSWPARDVLAIALGLAVRNPHTLHRYLLRAAQIALPRLTQHLAAKATNPKAEPAQVPTLDAVLGCMDGVHTAVLDRVPRAPKAGSTSVTGRVELVKFEPAPSAERGARSTK